MPCIKRHKIYRLQYKLFIRLYGVRNIKMAEDQKNAIGRIVREK